MAKRRDDVLMLDGKRVPMDPAEMKERIDTILKKGRMIISIHEGDDDDISIQVYEPVPSMRVLAALKEAYDQYGEFLKQVP